MYENKKGNTTISIIIIIILVIVVIFLCFVYRKSVMKTRITTNNLNNRIHVTDNKEKSTEEDTDEDLTISKDNEDIVIRLTEQDYKRVKNDVKKIFSYKNYDVMSYEITNKNTCNLLPLCNYDEDKNLTQYYVFENNRNKISALMNVGVNEDKSLSEYLYYFKINNKDLGGLVDIKNKNMIVGYDEFSCTFHSDERSVPCIKDELTIIGKDGKFGLVSLIDFKIILDVEYDYILYMEDKGQFLVEKNGKNGLLDKDLKPLLETKYDYIGYSEYLGYITIKNEKIALFDDKLKEIDLSKNDINVLNVNAYNKYKEKDTDAEKYLSLLNANSYYWSGGSILFETDLGKTYYFTEKDEESDGQYFKYTDTKYKGTNLIIFDYYGACTKNPKIYVLKKNKAYTINNNLIKIDMEEVCF